ncbi:alpha/beta hydrolase [Amycolatopsis methanolica]|uniref:Esterase/lipase n=1 Tax=Amycolatopsis methanolica 239 TaxID=1068978 RepID=A0A076MW97_AMYME|nr:alpha/beta hydrolase [Amycolatopsis methanolica]AIJ25009.1 esterase/lipase [Amycolatopsis methanolica 239]
MIGKTSLHAKLLIAEMLLTGRKRTFTDVDALHKSMGPRQQRENALPPPAVRKQVDVDRTEVHGHPVDTLRPRANATSRHVLYFHGGAYVHQIQGDHWKFFARLIARTGCAVTAPLYPLAPGSHYDDTLSMIHATYKEVLGEVDPRDQVLMGDSAGGGLSLVLARALRDEGRPQPKEVVMLSPWLDITMTDPALPEYDRHDPYLGVTGLREAGRLYAGDLDPANELVSPINGDLRGLGSLSCFIGTRDVLLADARNLYHKAKEQGVPLEYWEYGGMFHAWMIANIPEAKHSLDRIAELVTR